MPAPPTPYAAYDPAPPRPAVPVTPELAQAEASDVPELAALQVRVRGGSAADWSARLEEVVGRAGDAVVVARLGTELLGHGVLVRREAHQDGSPAGSYLMGVTVDPRRRRHGVATRLTRWRLDRVWRDEPDAWCFVSARNRASLALHEKLGFDEVARGGSFQGVTFTGGVGVLLRARRPSSRPG